MSRSDLAAEHKALMQETRRLTEEHDRLSKQPHDVLAHEAFSQRLRQHMERLHAHLERLGELFK